MSNFKQIFYLVVICEVHLYDHARAYFRESRTFSTGPKIE